MTNTTNAELQWDDHAQALYNEFKKANPGKVFLGLYKGYRREIFLWFLFYTLKHSPVWLLPLIIANIIDLLTLPTNDFLTGLLLNGGILLGLLLVHIPLTDRYMYYQSKVIRNTERSIRLMLTKHIQRLRLAFLSKMGEGVLHAKMMRDVTVLQNMADRVFTFFPSMFISVLFAVSVLIFKAPLFLLLFSITIPFIVFVVNRLEKSLAAHNKSFREDNEKVSSMTLTMFKLLPLTRAHSLEEISVRKLKRNLNGVNQKGKRLDLANNRFGAIIWVIFRVFEVCCLLISSYLAFKGYWGITVGTVVLLTGYASTLTASVMDAVRIVPELTKGFEAIRSIQEILKDEEIDLNVNGREISMVKGAVIFKNVSFSYSSEASVEQINFELPAGEVLGIVGPTGAGKSTLLNLLIGFISPHEGQIFIDGVDQAEMDLRSFRRHIAVVSQETVLFSGTIKENVLFGHPEAQFYNSDQLVIEALQTSGAWTFVSQLDKGIYTDIRGNGDTLSGGQRQQLAIARAVIRKPRILILDEASSALDAASERLIEHSLQQLPFKTTTIIVSHRLSTIERADRLIVLQGGRIVEKGTHDSLMDEKGLYHHLWTTQNSRSTDAVSVR